MIKSSNIFTITLIVVVLILIGYIFTQDKPDYVKDYNDKIEALEAKIDSLHSKNNILVIESDSLKQQITSYNNEIKQLNSRIYVIKKQTQQKVNNVDSFGNDELEEFFAERYGQHNDSIN
jgi:chromosome segregation ATPase